jgi:peptide/nickel transport system ATP-binding protein
MSVVPVADVRDLRVETNGGDAIIEDVSLELGRGEIIGLVGESGSGKTTLALSMLGYSAEGTRLTRGEIRIGDERVVQGDERAVRGLRGRLISYVPQSPGTSLNPAMRVEKAIAGMLQQHVADVAIGTHVARVLEDVTLPSDSEFRRRYPHQLSGGQQQRLCLGIALACRPPVVVLDEPTTGLDVVIQARVLEELRRLRTEHGVSMVYVTHDLAVVAQIADRIGVVYAGRLVELGPAKEILRYPRHPYTRGLLASIPDHVRPRVLEPMAGIAVGVGERPRGCSFAPRCPMHVGACDLEVPALASVASGRWVRCIRAGEAPRLDRPALELRRREGRAFPPVLVVSQLRAEHRSPRATIVAASDVAFTVGRGQCLALVGESGSGKTTIARAITGLHPTYTGVICLDGKALAPGARKRSREERRRIQMIFQNPTEALNPRHTARSQIARPARVLRGLSAREAGGEVDDLLDRVRLPRRTAERYPLELSGGEQQRVAIARALAAKPNVVVCDEVTSSLDVSVQAAVLELLASLRDGFGLAMLFITHDLGVVATISDEVVVLECGRICETGPVEGILRAPQHGYTKRLLHAAPSITEALRPPLQEFGSREPGLDGFDEMLSTGE